MYEFQKAEVQIYSYPWMAEHNSMEWVAQDIIDV